MPEWFKLFLECCHHLITIAFCKLTSGGSDWMNMSQNILNFLNNFLKKECLFSLNINKLLNNSQLMSMSLYRIVGGIQIISWNILHCCILTQRRADILQVLFWDENIHSKTLSQQCNGRAYCFLKKISIFPWKSSPFYPSNATLHHEKGNILKSHLVIAYRTCVQMVLYIQMQKLIHSNTEILCGRPIFVHQIRLTCVRGFKSNF